MRPCRTRMSPQFFCQRWHHHPISYTHCPTAKIKVKVADDVDADEYVDKLAREQEDSEIEETFSEAEDEDLTPPVPSYLTDSDEDVMREEKIRAFKQATNNIADTLTQWISNLEVSRDFHNCLCSFGA